LSTTQSQSIVTAFWKWDDGTTDLLADSTHTYAAVGNYNATLVAITDKGCADSVSQLYSVRGTLNVNFSKAGNCVPDSIVFSDSALTASSAIASRMWKANGANVSAVSPAKLFLNSAGPYTITYIVTTAEGCTDSITKNYTFTTYPYFQSHRYFTVLFG
jgi:PKD repeat protein